MGKEGKVRTWRLRGREAEVRLWKKGELEELATERGAEAQVAEGECLPMHAKEPGEHGSAVEVERCNADGAVCGTARVAVTSHRRLRRLVGYAQGCDGRVYEVRSARWLAVVLVLAAALAGAALQIAVRPDTSPLVTGGIVPVETVQVTSPEEVGQIVIPGYNDFEVGDGTKVALSNPADNSAYLLRYTCSVDGQQVHRSPYWVEPGKADLWDAAGDLSAYKGETVSLTIATEAVKAEGHQACNGSQQTVKVEVR